MAKRIRKETILVFSAHSDDFVIGAGGAIASYVQQGKTVRVIVMSYGEMSHPWLKGKVIQKIRSEEAFEAANVIGCKAKFFDLKEGKFEDEFKKKKIEGEILKLIKKEKPIKIFTHSSEDPHPDHRADNDITQELTEKLNYNPELYIYSVWNPVSFRTKYPSLYIKTPKTFFMKLKALNKFKSQKFQAIYPLMIMIFFRAIKDGFKIRSWFGEHFFRIK